MTATLALAETSGAFLIGMARREYPSRVLSPRIAQSTERAEIVGAVGSAEPHRDDVVDSPSLPAISARRLPIPQGEHVEHRELVRDPVALGSFVGVRCRVSGCHTDGVTRSPTLKVLDLQSMDNLGWSGGFARSYAESRSSLRRLLPPVLTDVLDVGPAPSVVGVALRHGFSTFSVSAIVLGPVL